MVRGAQAGQCAGSQDLVTESSWRLGSHLCCRITLRGQVLYFSFYVSFLLYRVAKVATWLIIIASLFTYLVIIS